MRFDINVGAKWLGKLRKGLLFTFFFLLITSFIYAAEQAAVEEKPPLQQQAAPEEIKESGLMGSLKGFTKSFKSNGGYLDFGLRTGYMGGHTSFDFNHHVSELEYPFQVYLGGGKINLGYKDLSCNSEFWGSLVNDPSAGWNMKDKDWDEGGELESDTKSQTNMNAVIWDANFCYNFLKHSFGKETVEEESQKSDNIKLGLLVGYRYQRYGYKGYGLYQTASGDGGAGDGDLVFEYKVKYHLPYYGLALDVSGKKFGILMNAKYAFSPTVNDLDNHVLRSLNFYGDYKKNPNVFMANFIMFWKFHKNWDLNLGADASLIRLDGRVHEDQNSPAWDADQSIDTKQFIYWLGVGYRF